MPDNQRKQILNKVCSWCAYQDRSTKQTWLKLLNSGLSEEDAVPVLKQLQDEGFVDDERFASAYARGKFHNNHWGREKIRQGLEQNDLKEKVISRALAEIDDTEYLSQLRKLISNKSRELQRYEEAKRKEKIYNFALSKGYEVSLVLEIINE
jgi:regulatory protein